MSDKREQGAGGEAGEGTAKKNKRKKRKKKRRWREKKTGTVAINRRLSGTLMDVSCRSLRNRRERSREYSFDDIVRSAARQSQDKDLHHYLVRVSTVLGFGYTRLNPEEITRLFRALRMRPTLKKLVLVLQTLVRLSVVRSFNAFTVGRIFRRLRHGRMLKNGRSRSYSRMKNLFAEYLRPSLQQP